MTLNIARLPSAYGNIHEHADKVTLRFAPTAARGCSKVWLIASISN